MNDERPILLSGIKPTGNLHIGNYFGAIRQQVELFEKGKYRCFIMIADYHALTTVKDAQEMQTRTHELVMGYLASGLDPQKVVLFKQSDVPAHTELAWIFDTLITVPYLMRAHAFKDAQAKNKEINVGVFNYPLLMAADILLYNAAVVPVGQDQKQHIEITRDVAEKFNNTFGGDTFSLPEPYIPPDVAVVPGTDGRKMSKSYNNVIPLFGSHDELHKRVMSIVTDSSGERPENVYAIHRLIRSEAELASIYEENKGKYKILKEALVTDLDAFLSPLRERYEALKSNPSIVKEVLASGGKSARAITEIKMKKVRSIIGVA